MHVPLDLVHETHMHKSKGTIITKDTKTTGSTTSDTGESQQNEAAPVAGRPSAHLRPLSILSSLSFLKLRSSNAWTRTRQRANGFQNELTEDEEVVVHFKRPVDCTSSPIEKTKRTELNSNQKVPCNIQNAHQVKDCYANLLNSLPNVIHNESSNKLYSKKVEAKAQHSRSGDNQVHLNKVSHIYGSVENSVGFTGSFALHNSGRMCDQGRDLMTKQQSVSLHNLDDELNKPPRNQACTAGVNHKSWWRVEGGSYLEVRASHLLKLVCLLMVLTFVAAFTFHSRIRQLEAQRTELIQELSGVKMHLEILIDRMDTVVSLAIPTKSSRAASFHSEQLEGDDSSMDAKEESDQILEKVGARNGKRVLVKRSAAAGRTTKDLQFPSSSFSFNTLNNGSAAFDNLDDTWSPGVTPKDEKTKSPKGNLRNKRLSRKVRKLVRKELKDFKAAQRIKLNTLKRKLSESRLQKRLLKLSCCIENTSSSHNLSKYPGDAEIRQKTGVRAAYLQIDGTSVNIKKPKLELIGPWYLPESGDDIGFNDLWYNNLALDSNGTTIIFEESGLYMIYSQVFYQLQRSPKSHGSPLGYRIYLKKSQNKRAIPIAECVPSYPQTVYQTCFTQVTWFVEAQDEIYLEHFTDSLPMIDALRSGQTFLGIVQLSM
ncbi:hypothetical protein Ocin01_04796 [Orchesella cincta]|uniref:THD domain-containing protein n=1 Tax=Orchesella cincta TaxID=48709 RepID=A0A1D2N9I3_ORCCI|nr:hypothetical protein Ocin01_04796 [Orchesella cincta]